MSKKPCHDPGACGCGAIAFERNRYFTGKYMAARDFSGEQEYFLTRHRMHNRVLHGWGVVCGLRVVPHPDPHCRRRWVVVKAGIAIDCCGRELVLPCDTPLELTEIPHDPEPAPSPEPHAPEPHSPEHEQQAPPQYYPVKEFLVCVTYTEELIEQVPALYNEGACDPARTEANRVREVPRLVLLDPEKYPKCWRRKILVNPSEHLCD